MIHSLISLKFILCVNQLVNQLVFFKMTQFPAELSHQIYIKHLKKKNFNLNSAIK